MYQKPSNLDPITFIHIDSLPSSFAKKKKKKKKFDHEERS